MTMAKMPEKTRRPVRRAKRRAKRRAPGLAEEAGSWSAEVQTILGADGEPAYAVVPWSRWRAMAEAAKEFGEDLRDAAIADAVKADLAAGRQELLPATMVERLAEGEAPIRLWREHRGLTQDQLAAATGLGQGYLSQLESGRKANPTLEALTKIARALNCRLDDLIVEPADDDQRVEAAPPEESDEEAVPLAVARRLVEGEHPLKVWREYRGLTKKALAAEAGTSALNLSKIERGQRTASPKLLRRLADALAVEIDDLVA